MATLAPVETGLLDAAPLPRTSSSSLPTPPIGSGQQPDLSTLLSQAGTAIENLASGDDLTGHPTVAALIGTAAAELVRVSGDAGLMAADPGPHQPLAASLRTLGVLAARTIGGPRPADEQAARAVHALVAPLP